MFPAHEATPKAKAIFVQADQVADALGLDDETSDGPLVGLGLGYVTAATAPNRQTALAIPGIQGGELLSEPKPLG